MLPLLDSLLIILKLCNILDFFLDYYLEYFIQLSLQMSKYALKNMINWFADKKS